MRRDTTRAKIKKVEIKRNNKISKKRYIRFQPVGLPGRRVEQYFGLSHLHNGAYRARFTVMMKNIWDAMCRTDGVQPVSWIETASGDIRERSTRGMGFGYMECLERLFWPHDRIKMRRELKEE